jgi:hypothetical protein
MFLTKRVVTKRDFKTGRFKQPKSNYLFRLQCDLPGCCEASFFLGQNKDSAAHYAKSEGFVFLTSGKRQDGVWICPKCKELNGF